MLEPILVLIILSKAISRHLEGFLFGYVFLAGKQKEIYLSLSTLILFSFYDLSKKS